MSMVFFVDESGQDRRNSQAYEVVGGVAIPQKELWPFICAVRHLLSQHFGITRLSANQEFKGTKLLTNRRLAQAAQRPEIPIVDRRSLVQEFFAINQWNLQHPAEHRQLRNHHFVAYTQSCRFFSRDVLLLCQKHSARVLAAVIAPEASPIVEDTLRSDYAGLFYKLFECSSDDIERRSMIVHDENDDSLCRKLAEQLYVYYVNEGRSVAERVIPEPMFVKSHLTLGVLVADLVVYILSWSFRHAHSLTLPSRVNLGEFAELLRTINGIPDEVPEDLDEYGILYIENLADLEPWTKRAASQV